ncbi:hypothetical protein BH10PSE3_BH10PSE3_09140 [soil metagenome]
MTIQACHPGQARSAPIRDRRLSAALPAVPGLRFATPGMTAAIALALASCGPAKTPPAPPPPQAVEAVAVAAPRASGGVTATGALERRREMALSFRIAGVLTKVAVEAGDAVRAGQVLATIDPGGVEALPEKSFTNL